MADHLLVLDVVCLVPLFRRLDRMDGMLRLGLVGDIIKKAMGEIAEFEIQRNCMLGVYDEAAIGTRVALRMYHGDEMYNLITR